MSSSINVEDIANFTVSINDTVARLEKCRLVQTEIVALMFADLDAAITSASSIPASSMPIITKNNIAKIDEIDPRIKNIIGIPKDLEEFPCMLKDSDTMGLLGRDVELNEVVDALLEIIQNITF